MSKFVKYPHIENTYQTKFIEKFVELYPELKDESYIITEKIHGANISFLFEPKLPFRYAKRTSFIEPTDSFNDIHNVVKNYQTLINEFQKYVDSTGYSIRLFGELFGPKIQKGVNYGDTKQIKFFDMMIDDKLVPPNIFLDFPIDHWSDYHVPVISITDGLEGALNYNCEFNSSILGVPDNICEGIVIKPRSKVYYDALGRLFYLKKKNDKFKEISRKPKTPKQDRALDNPLIAKLNAQFQTYINDNRVQSVFSKHGAIQEPKDIGKYIKLVLKDAEYDFCNDNWYIQTNPMDILTEKEWKKVYNVGSQIVQLLKKYL